MAKRKAIPDMPFNTGEWLSHPGLKVLPPDVRGLWIDMLCYMWESAERGVMVKPNLEIYTREDIRRLIGVDLSGSDAWLDKLVEHGVCAVRSDGAYYSRQMVRNEEIRNKRRLAGKKGGDITKAKVFTSVPNDNAQSTPTTTAPPGQGDLFEPEAPPPLTPEQKAKAEKAKKYPYAEFVTLTRDEYAKLCEKYSEESAKRMIEILDNYKGSKGVKYKSDYRTILNWVVDKYNEEKQRYGSKNNGGASTAPKPPDPTAYNDTL